MGDLSSQPPDPIAGLPQEIVHLYPIFDGYFPHKRSTLFVIPTLKSFAIVRIPRKRWPNHDPTIRVFSFTFSNGKSSFEEISSIDVPGELIDFTLPIPPTPARYALGVLCTKQHVIAAEETQKEKYEWFAVKIYLSSQGQDPTLRNGCPISLTKLNLGPALEEPAENLEAMEYFDPFSGKIILSDYQNRQHKTNVVIDFLSKAL